VSTFWGRRASHSPVIQVSGLAADIGRVTGPSGSGKPPPDLFELRPAVSSEKPTTESSFPWRRLALAYLLALGAALLFRLAPWAVLAFPAAACLAQTVYRFRWPYRVISAVVFAAYAAQIGGVIVSAAGWGVRFGASFVFGLTLAFCWGLRTDGL
jgi:hypothetical protein